MRVREKIIDALSEGLDGDDLDFAVEAVIEPIEEVKKEIAWETWKFLDMSCKKANGEEFSLTMSQMVFEEWYADKMKEV